MKFGVFSVSMPEYTPEETVPLLKELGFDGVEWRVAEPPANKPDKVPYELRYWQDNKSTIYLAELDEKADAIRRLCDENGIEIFSLTTYLSFADLEKVEAVLKVAKRIGVPKVRVFPARFPGDKDLKTMESEAVSNIRALEKLAAKYDVKILFEIHMDTIMASPSEAYRLIQGCDPKYIGLIFDPGNMVNEGFEDYDKSFQLLGSYIAHIHIKNGALVNDGTDQFGATKWKRQWTPLKEGMANLALFLEIMQKYGYDGTVSIEDFSNKLTTVEKLKDNLAYMKQLAEAAQKKDAG